MRSPVPAIVLLLALLHGRAFACSCRTPSLDDQVANAKHVFVAQIMSASLSPDGKSTIGTFVAKETFKGDPMKVPSIHVDFSDHSYMSGLFLSCGNLTLPPGAHFLVFADEDGSASYGSCSNTKQLQHRNDVELQLLRRNSAHRASDHGTVGA